MEKTMQALIDQLDEKIPRDAVQTREMAGVKLSYLPGWYVIDRLNKIIGHGNWSYSIGELKAVHIGTTTDRYGKTKFVANYLARVQLYINLPEQTAHYEEVGFGDAQDANNEGKVHELASKEAVTDALKRAAKNLGMSMGLALYDKSQENVAEQGEDVTPERPQPPEVTKKTKASTTTATLGLISSTAAVAIAKKRVSVDDLISYMQKNYSVDSKEKLNDTQAKEFLEYLRTVIK